MKKVFVVSALMLVVAGCTNNKPVSRDFTSDAEVLTEKVEFHPHSFLMTSKRLPDKIDLDMDIDDMTMMELRLLRNYPFALKGLWFMESDVNQFFQQKSDWYMKRCDAYLEAHDWHPLMEEAKAGLTDKETAFVKRVDERIKQLSGQQTVERDGLRLSNPVMTVNMFQYDDYDAKFLAMLGHHNFAVMPSDRQQLFNIYEENDYTMTPNYITTDLYLQAFHMYFEYVMKSLEKGEFAPRLHNLNVAMYEKAKEIATSTDDAKLKKLAENNAAFFAVAERLLTNKGLSVPASYASDVRTEVDNVYKAVDDVSPMMKKAINFPYSLFKPRGHYTRSEESQRYFRYMMWLQTYTFCRENQESLEQAVLMAYLLKNIDASVAAGGIGVYHVLDFLMGEPDNVAVVDIADYMAKHTDFTLADITDVKSLQKINEYLVGLFKTRNRITSKIAEDGCEDKINFMPQRYTADGYILSKTYDPTPNCELPFPRGLHVFSAFGVKDADIINDDYYEDAKKWSGYENKMKTLKYEFKNYKDWNKSMYNKWMECLVELQKVDKDYPDYMKTTSWSKKNINTALASWSELKHDAILYAEQPIVAECGSGGDYPDPILVGYVEPNLKFWNKMKEMLTLTRALLTKNGLMTDDLDGKTQSLEDYMDFCIKVSEKELAGETLTEEEYNEIRYLGSSMEWFTLGVIDPDLDLYSWDLVKGADRSIAVVADVFTRNVLKCKKCGILYEATGNADIIYVNVVIGGKVYLTRGATFSYYEFVNPLGSRLTDEEWQKKLDGDAPGRPVWMQPLLLDKAPKANEEIFYSTGC